MGGDGSVAVDIRVIVATNKDLDKQVAQGLFREDLFYRIHVIPLELPPLRERKEDIPLLVDHFLRKYGKQMNKDVKGLTPGPCSGSCSMTGPGTSGNWRTPSSMPWP